MANSPELKPCPFCGEEHDMVIRFSKFVLPLHKAGTHYSVGITCRKCWVSVHGRDMWQEEDAYNDAVEAWNLRASRKEADNA